MTETPTHTPLPCPCCRSAEIENERPDSPVYCRKCWLRAVDLERWNTRADSHHRFVEAREALRAFHDGMLSRSETIAKIDAALKECPPWIRPVERVGGGAGVCLVVCTIRGRVGAIRHKSPLGSDKLHSRGP